MFGTINRIKSSSPVWFCSSFWLKFCNFVCQYFNLLKSSLLLMYHNEHIWKEKETFSSSQWTCSLFYGMEAWVIYRLAFFNWRQFFFQHSNFGQRYIHKAIILSFPFVWSIKNYYPLLILNILVLYINTKTNLLFWEGIKTFRNWKFLLKVWE